MVDALREAWRVLEVDGVLIDLRPLDSSRGLVELVTPEKAIPVGEMDASGFASDDAAADRAAARAVDEGWFLPQRALHLDFELSWDTVDEMASFMAESRRMREVRPSFAELEKMQRAWRAKTRGRVRLRYWRTMLLAAYQKVAAHSQQAALPSPIGLKTTDSPPRATVSITVREYRDSDARSLADLYYDTIHRVNARDYSAAQIQAWAPLEARDDAAWKTRFAKTRPFVAELDDRVAGFAELGSDGHIDCFYCRADCLRQGVGSALMGRIVRVARDGELREVHAAVSSTAKPFFESAGFEVLGEDSVTRRGVNIERFVMRLRLERSDAEP